MIFSSVLNIILRIVSNVKDIYFAAIQRFWNGDVRIFPYKLQMCQEANDGNQIERKNFIHYFCGHVECEFEFLI